MGPGVEELGFMGLEHFNTNTGRQLDSPISTSLWPRVRPIHRGSLRLLSKGRGFERHFRANGFLSLKFPAERAANGMETSDPRHWPGNGAPCPNRPQGPMEPISSHFPRGGDSRGNSDV